MTLLRDSPKSAKTTQTLATQLDFFILKNYMYKLVFICRLGNCTEAMQLAKSELNIPIVVRPEDFSSPHLDDLSGMTYLSYYMKVDSPGYFATRRETKNLLQNKNIDNFQVY